MKRICTEHHIAHADAFTRDRVQVANAMAFSWDLTTEPYGGQRPSGVPPS